MRFLMILQFCLLYLNCHSQQDTIIGGKHFNTIIYYSYFDYKGVDTIKNNYVTGIGNTVDSLKTGVWTYYLNNGKILAQGKYKNGYKNGKWCYMNSGTVLIWERSAKAKDHIRYNVITKRPEIIDVVNTKEISYKMINGCNERSPLIPHFL